MNAAIRQPVILQVLPALDSGGIERGTIEMVSALSQAGATPLVASGPGRLLAHVRHAGGRHFLIDMRSKNPIRIFLNARKLAKLIRSEKVDLVHARSRVPAWVARRACRKTKTPFVTTWHGLHAESFVGKKRYNAVLAAGDRIIAISDFIAERIMRSHGPDPAKLRVIPRGADMNIFSPDLVRGDRIQSLAQKWNLPDGAAVIILPARLTEWKGGLLLIEALGILQKSASSLPPWVCVFVGGEGKKDKFSQKILSRARSLGIASNIRFAGDCADMPAALMTADAVVVPSTKPEPFGRSVVEAQAMERVVIVADHGGASETVIDGGTGLTFPPNDARALADAIAMTIEAPRDARQHMGENARRHVLEHFTTAKMQSATLGVYDELLHTSLQATFVSPQPKN